MKNTILLALFLFATIHCSAQQDDFLDIVQSTIHPQNHNISISNRSTYQLDSTYNYLDPEAPTYKRIYSNYSDLCDWQNSESFDFENGNWNERFRNERAFDAQFNILADTSYIHFNGAYELSTMNTYEYDANNNLTAKFFVEFNPLTFEWAIWNRFLYYYNSDNNLEVVEEYILNPVTQIYRLDKKYTNTYENGLLTEELYQIFDNTDSVLINRSKDIHFYSNSELKDSTYSYGWYDNSTDWELVGRNIYDYQFGLLSFRRNDSFDNSLNDWVIQEESVATFFEDHELVQYWDYYILPFSSTELVLLGTTEYFYTFDVVDTENTNATELSMIHANPFSQNDQVEIIGVTSGQPTTFTLSNLEGIIIYQTTFKQDTSIPLNMKIPNGMYIISLIQQDKVALSKKVLKME